MQVRSEIQAMPFCTAHQPSNHQHQCCQQSINKRRLFITLSIHLCVQHDWRQATCCAGSSATAETCQFWNSHICVRFGIKYGRQQNWPVGMQQSPGPSRTKARCLVFWTFCVKTESCSRLLKSGPNTSCRSAVVGRGLAMSQLYINIIILYLYYKGLDDTRG